MLRAMLDSCFQQVLVLYALWSACQGHSWVGLAALEHLPGTPRDVLLKKGNPAIGSAMPLFQESFFLW